MLGRVVAEALQREVAGPPPAGADPAAVLARALRLAGDAAALAAATPALDDFTALCARCAPRVCSYNHLSEAVLKVDNLMPLSASSHCRKAMCEDPTQILFVFLGCSDSCPQFSHMSSCAARMPHVPAAAGWQARS